MRGVAQRGGERRFELGGVDDPGQLRDAGRPGGKLHRRARHITLDAHVVHRRARVGRQAVPDLERTQQADRTGIQRIGAHIGRGAGCAVPGPGNGQAQARQGQRGGHRHRPGAAHADIESRHGHGL
jgi:hypothetical protein